MASMGGGPLNVEPVLRLVMSRGMLNKNLQEICKSEGIRHTNLKKADLQHNIEESMCLLRLGYPRRIGCLPPVAGTFTDIYTKLTTSQG